MTNAAWAFVRPYEITKGALAAQEAQNKQDKFEVDMAQAQEQSAYLAQQRAVALEQQRQTLDYTKQLNPLQIQQQSMNLQNNGMATATNAENFQQNQWKLAAQKLLQVNVEPGDPENTTFKAMLNRVENISDPNIKFHAVQQLQEQSKVLALAALNKGNPTAAHDILLAANSGPIPTMQAFGAMPPQQQFAQVTNTQLTGQMPDPKVALENLKTLNEIKVKQAPSADSQNKLVMEEANRTAPPTVADMSKLYIQYVVDSNKNGMKPMLFEDFTRQFNTSNGTKAPGNSVSSAQQNPQGPGGVPYR